MKEQRKLGLAALVVLTALLASGSSNTNTIEISVKRFSFTPDHITVKKGQPVILVLQSHDVTHGLTIKEFGIRTDIPKGKDTRVTFTPEVTGTFQGRCSHFCGSGHGSMNFTVTVTE